jgi:signal transduction histidine kinase
MTRTARAADDASAPPGYGRVMRRILTAVDRFWLDGVVVLLMVGGISEIVTNDDVEGPRPWLIAFVFLWTTPLLFRRRHPVLAPALVFVAVGVQTALWNHSVPYQFFTFAAALISAGMLGMNLITRRQRIAGGALAVATVATVVALDPEGGWTDLISTGAVIGVAWLVGYILRSNANRTAELRERAERLEREREANARAAVAEERTRIAREMHDVVAHSLSVMVVQAEAAEEMIGIDPERARRPLSAVQDTGRAALTELRRMLGVLREIEEGPDLAPQPGLAGLDALVAHVREAGLPVELRVEGEPRPLSPTGDLQAYRIVQEALTNALKHAGPARAHVLVRYEAADLVIEVTDDGRGYDPDTDGGGHGLIGMRERVAVCGGEMSAGRRAQGGFEVMVRLPIGAAVAR